VRRSFASDGKLNIPVLIASGDRLKEIPLELPAAGPSASSSTLAPNHDSTWLKSLREIQFSS